MLPIDYLGLQFKTLPAVLNGEHTKLTSSNLFRKNENKEQINLPLSIYGGQTLLFLACTTKSANVQVIHELFDNDAASNIVDNCRRNIMHIAANVANPEILDELLSWHDIALLVDDVDANGQTPFHALFMPGIMPVDKALNADIIACLEKMLAASKDSKDLWKILNTQDLLGITPLMLAKYYEIKPVLKYVEDKFGRDKIKSVSLVDALKDKHDDFYNRSPLIIAILKNDLSAVKQALKKYPADAVDPYSGLTMLQLACCYANNPKIIAKILAKTTLPLFPDQNGRTALHIACATNNLVAVKELLKNSAIKSEINKLDNKGRTCLHALAIGSSLQQVMDKKQNSQVALQIIEILLSNELNFDVIDQDRQTAAKLAYHYNQQEVAEKISGNAHQQKDNEYLRNLSPIYSPGFDNFKFYQMDNKLDLNDTAPQQVDGAVKDKSMPSLTM